MFLLGNVIRFVERSGEIGADCTLIFSGCVQNRDCCSLDVQPHGLAPEAIPSFSRTVFAEPASTRLKGSGQWHARTVGSGPRAMTEFDCAGDKTGVSVECEHCFYEWTYSGSLDRATCPRCYGKVHV